MSARYGAAAAFAPLKAETLDTKMSELCTSLEKVYGALPFANKEWETSVLGTLVGLICAQTCRNSWSSIGYANIQATFPGADGEPDWEAVRRRRPEDIEACINHGPYFITKAQRIHELICRAAD